MHLWVFLRQEEAGIRLTVLAMHSTEAWWTLAEITNESVPPVGLTDLTCSSVVARVWMARACMGKEIENNVRSLFVSNIKQLF